MCGVFQLVYGDASECAVCFSECTRYVSDANRCAVLDVGAWYESDSAILE